MKKNYNCSVINSRLNVIHLLLIGFWICFVPVLSLANSYSSSSVAQVTGNVIAGSTNQQILVVTVIGNSTGFLQDWKINTCSFTMSNTNNADITSAKLWMNSSNNFGTATQVGTTINNPSGTIIFTVNSSAIGNNSRFLFLTFDIASTAPCSGNSVDAFVPTNGLVIGSAGVFNGGNAGNKTPSPNNPGGNRPIFNQVIPSVSISSSGGGSCSGAVLSYTAAAVNGGPSPFYQWKVNGNNVGSNSSNFSMALINGDQVTCQLTSNATCASPATVNSNTLTVSLFDTPKPKVSPSDTVVCTGAFFTIVAQDTGIWASGYPAGTLFDFGTGPSVVNSYLVNGSGNYTVQVTLPPANGGCSASSNTPNFIFIDAPIAQLTSDTIKCNGETNGSVYAQIFLGTIPFHYKWYSNGILIRDTISSQVFDTIKNIGAGSYCLVVSDSIAGNQSALVCASDSTCIEVTGPTLLSVSAIKSNESCLGVQDGSIQVTVSGGTPPYTYFWSNGSTDEDLSQLAIGTYTITVTDNNGCLETKTRNIMTQQDTINPSLNCPVNILMNASSGQCSAIVTYVTPVATDNCAGVNTIQTAGLPSGSVFPLGETMNSFLATDSAGNTTLCTFMVTVVDNEPPTIVCPSSTSVNNDTGSCGAIVTYSLPLVSDNCSPVTLIQTSGLTSGSLFPIGLTVNSFLATDSIGNSSTCSFTITVIDNTPPIISCVQDTVLINNPGVCGAVFTYSITSSDNCAAPISQSSGFASGSIFPIGTTLNTFTANDPSGNSVTCSFNVTVLDNQPPLAQCHNLSLVLNASGFVVIDPLLLDSGSSDNCGIASRTVSPDTLTCLQTGLNTVLLTVTDVHGNVSSCSATVTVSSTLSVSVAPDPVDLCLGGNVLLNGNPTGGTGIYITHHWSGDNTFLNDTTTALATFMSTTTGLFTVLYSVTDNMGCTASGEVDIEVFPALQAGVFHTDVTCFGGSNGFVSSTVTGGSGVVTYQWSNGSTLGSISGVQAGSYTVTISDIAGCSSVLNEIVAQPPLLIVSTSSTPASCGSLPDGTATAAASGGTGLITYLWSDGQTLATATGLAAGVYSVTVTDQLGCSQSTTQTVLPLTINLSLNGILHNGGFHLSCAGGNDGSIDLTVLSGAGPFTYLWSNGLTTEDISGAGAGSYTVTVSNGFCTSTQSFLLTEPSPVTVALSPTAPLCFSASNGTISALASGGISDYSYSWNTIPIQTTATATGIVSGNYSVLVADGNGCSISNSTFVSQPSAVTVNASLTNVACKGNSTGAIDLTPNGGTPPYSFIWNTGQTTEDRFALKASVYTITVTDSHGCFKKITTNIIEPSQILQVFTNKTNVRCFGGSTGSISVFPFGGVFPYSYSWNTIPVKTTSNLNNIQAGTYTCSITDAAGCTKTVTQVITQPTLIVLTTTQSNVSVFGGSDGSASVSVSGGIPNYSYLWYTSPAKTTPSITNLSAGTYKVKVTDNKGCTKTALLSITQPPARFTGSANLQEQRVSVFPNPGNGLFTLRMEQFKTGQVEVKLLDVLGNKVYTDQLSLFSGGSNVADYDFTRFTKGVYLLEIKTTGFRRVIRVIIQ